jgi:anti-sigma factor (TIGR02949 family)
MQQDRTNCQEIQQQLDGFLDGGIEAGARSRVEAHIEQCAGCAQEVAARRSLRVQLRSAVQNVEIPAYLETRVRAHVASDRWRYPRVLKLAAVAGAALVLAVTTFAYERGYMRWTPQSRESYIASVSGQVATLMRVGLGDHVHCAVFRKYPKAPPSMTEFVAKMGPDYGGIIPIVREHVPSDFRILLAHRCTYHARQFVHMVLGSDSALLSVVIARKSEGEAFQADEIMPELSDAGISIYTSNVQRFQIAAFESRDHVVYVISDMPGRRNMEMMQAMAPALKTFLDKLAS